MSLSKQLLALISLIFLVIFTISLFLSLNSIRDYLQVESDTHTQDTATSLGLSLSPHMNNVDDPIIETMMKAIFDTGYYQDMRLDDPDNKELIALSNKIAPEGVPDWLIKMFPIEAATSMTEINSGWMIAGKLYITSNPSYAYIRLYQQVKQTLIYAAIIFLFAFVSLLLVLRLTLRPLQAIQHQANAIAENQFEVMQKLPWTTEVREVAIAMNHMSNHIAETTNNLNQRVERLSDTIKRDPLTQLFNKSTFSTDLRRELSVLSTGYICYIKIDDLNQLVKHKDNHDIDEIIKGVAKLLLEVQASASKAYRLSGSEFALVITTEDNDTAAMSLFASQLQQELGKLSTHYQLSNFCHIGVIRYEQNTEFEHILPSLIESYEKAKHIDNNAFYIREETVGPRSAMAWKNAINHIIEFQSAELNFISEAYCYDVPETPTCIMREAFAEFKDKNQQPLSVATCFSMASEFDLAEALDRSVIDKLMSRLEQDTVSCPITINLTVASVTSPSFYEWLQSRLNESSIPKHYLTFSVTAYAAKNNLKAVSQFFKFVRSLNATTLLKRFSPDLIDIQQLRELHVDYIRLARDLTKDIQLDRHKQDLLATIDEITNLLNIKVIAEDVESDEDFELVKASSIYGLSR